MAISEIESFCSFKAYLCSTNQKQIILPHIDGNGGKGDTCVAQATASGSVSGKTEFTTCFRSLKHIHTGHQLGGRSKSDRGKGLS